MAAAYNNIYHQTSQALYLDNGDGSLTVVYRKNRKPAQSGNNICHVKNNAQGRNYIQTVVRPHCKKTIKRNFDLKFHYRCPNDGYGYDLHKTTNSFGFVTSSRRGSVSKHRGLVINVRVSLFP
jgi:hypothetical protein